MTAHKDKTHCPKGHPYSGRNLIVDRYENGKQRRRCRACDLERSREYQARKRLKEMLGE
jgi:hypothetical protein